MSNHTENPSWEAKCRRCGRCCYEKLLFNGRVYYTDVPCERLDPKTGLCTVYSRRFKARPGCMPLTPETLRQGILPGDCPYVDGLPNYPAPCLWEEEEV